MQELAIYFDPIFPDEYPRGAEGRTTLADVTTFNTGKDFPEVEDGHIAIIGVCEGRAGVQNNDADQAPDRIREYLYSLHTSGNPFRLVDLGNIKAGDTTEDTYYAVQNCVEYLVKNKVVPLIIGGTQDLTYANYRGYELLEQTVNLLVVDPRIDMGDVEGPIDSEAYLGKIVLHQPNYLFNFTALGYQSYFVDGSSLELMDGLYFDTYRLGEIRNDMSSAEPAIRNADVLSFDMAAIRQSDAPGALNASPHGFYGEEACQILRYAGMSDKLSSLGLYNYDPEHDPTGQTAQLMAHMAWYFMEGYYGRKTDFPIGDKEDYVKYRVSIQDHKHELIFLKSPKSDRWWMEVPYPPDKRLKFERHCLVPCRYSDYESALKEEMPDLWWKTYKKLG